MGAAGAAVRSVWAFVVLVVVSYVLWPGAGTVPGWYEALATVCAVSAVANWAVATWQRRIGSRQDAALAEGVCGVCGGKCQRELAAALQANQPAPTVVLVFPNQRTAETDIAEAVARLRYPYGQVLPPGWHATRVPPTVRATTYTVRHADGSPCSAACQARWQS